MSRQPMTYSKLRFPPQRRQLFPLVVLSLFITTGGYMALVQNLRSPLVLFVAIGSGLTAGIFFAFSTFVMQALGQQTTAAGIATMQSINITVINPWFMAVFLGPGLIGLLLSLTTFRQFDQPEAFYWLAGTVIYLIGTIGVTIVGNIPLNDALALVNPDSTAGANLWNRYLTNWTLWNHVRTVAAVIAAVLFTLGQ